MWDRTHKNISKHCFSFITACDILHKNCYHCNINRLCLLILLGTEKDLFHLSILSFLLFCLIFRISLTPRIIIICTLFCQMVEAMFVKISFWIRQCMQIDEINRLYILIQVIFLLHSNIRSSNIWFLQIEGSHGLWRNIEYKVMDYGAYFQTNRIASHWRPCIPD